MLTLIINHNNKLLLKKELNQQDVQFINGQGTHWIMNCFKTHFNLDISNYRIDELQIEQSKIMINIKPEDLEKLRDNKLNSLLENETPTTN